MDESAKCLQQFNSKLKKYSARQVAKLFASFNREYFKYNGDSPITHKYSNGFNSYELLIQPWLFNRIVFASTKFSDYRSDITVAQGWELYGLYHNYFMALDGEYAQNNYADSTKNILTPIIYGHMQEQSIYQVTMNLFINRFNRTYFLLKNRKFQDIDISDLIYEKYKIDLDTYVQVISFMALLSVSNIILNDDDILNFFDGKELFLNILDDCSIDYSDCRDYNGKIDTFRIKPILKTSYKEYIVPNVNTMFYNLGDKLYWLMKDHFSKSTIFVNQFGDIFENYVFDILVKQYGQDSVKKIERVKGEKSADFIVEGTKYIFLVEVKSGVAGAEAKLQNLNQKTLDFYIDNNISDAMEQLDASSKKFNDGRKIICLILNYDLSFMEDSLLLDISKKYNPKNFDIKNLLYFGIDYFENLIAKYDNLNKLEKLFDSYEDKELNVHSLTEGCEIIPNYFFEDIFNKRIDEFGKKLKHN